MKMRTAELPIEKFLDLNDAGKQKGRPKKTAARVK